MPAVANCSSFGEVRANIDRIDRQIAELLAERGCYVKQTVQFKKTPSDVRAPKRVEQVILSQRKWEQIRLLQSKFTGQ
jgi:isochorismate pyruvate lyase